MKLKGINPIEQHVEKIVVGVVGLVFLIVVATQFVGAGNRVDVGSQSVPLDSAYGLLADRAASKLAQLNDESVDPRVPAQVQDLSDAIASSWTAPATGVDSARLPVAWTITPEPLIDGGTEAPDPSGGKFRVAAVAPSAPAPPIAANYGAAVDPVLVASEPELAAVAPSRQPYDVRSVTIASEFSAADLLDRMSKDPDGDGPRNAAPGVWWRGRIEIVDVIVERQETLPAGGEGAIEIVAPLPGRFSLREALEGGVDPGAMQDHVQAARVNARDIVQPLFYRIVAGERWAPPGNAADNRTVEIHRLLQDLKAVRAEIAKLEEQLRADASEAMDDRLRRTMARRQPGGRGGGGSRTPTPEASPTDTAAQREEQLEERLNARIASYRERETTLLTNLASLGFNVETGQPPDPMVELLNLPTRVNDAADSIRIWAHDVGVKPGATYRYRMRVAVNNPLFANSADIAPEDQSEAMDPVLVSEASEWSAPVRVDDAEYWFATRATPGGQQAIGRTNASCQTEVFTFYYGFWRRAESRLQAGDQVIAVLDLAEKQLPIYQIDVGDTGPFASGIAEQLTEPIVADTGAIILDVRVSALSARTSPEFEVIVREAHGALTVRKAATELASALRSRLESNWLQGQNAVVLAPGEAAVAPSDQPTDPAAAPPAPTEEQAPRDGRTRPRGR